MARAGLDEYVVDALGLQPGEQEVPEPVWRDMLCASPALAAYRASMARTPRVEYGFFHKDSNRKAAPLSRAALMCRARGLFEGAGKRTSRILACLALGDADPAGVEVDVAEADADEFGDPDAGVEQGFDEHDVAAAAGGPDGLVIAADLVSVGT